MTKSEALLGKKVTLIGFRRKYVVVGAPEENVVQLVALEGGLRDSVLQVSPDEVEISLSQNKAFVGSVARQLKNTYDSFKARFDREGVPYHQGYIPVKIGEAQQPSPKYIRAQVGAEDARLLGYHPESQIRLMVDPKAFLELVDPGFVNRASHAFSQQSYDKVLKRIQDGEPLDSVFLDVDVKTGDVIGHEGRHRCAAAIALGVTKVPAILYLREVAHRYVGYVRDASLHQNAPAVVALINKLHGSDVEFVGEEDPEHKRHREMFGYDEGVDRNPKSQDLVERFHAVLSRISELHQAQKDEKSQRSEIEGVFAALEPLLLETSRAEVALSKADEATQASKQWIAVNSELTDHLAQIVPEVEQILEEIAQYMTRVQQNTSTSARTVQQMLQQLAAHIKQHTQQIVTRYQKSLDSMQTGFLRLGFYADAEQRMTQECVAMPETIACLQRSSQPEHSRIRTEIREATRFVSPSQHRRVLYGLTRQITKESTPRQIREIAEEVISLIEDCGVRVVKRVDNSTKK